MTQITITTKSGITLTGSVEDVTSALKKLGETPTSDSMLYYSSSHRKYIRISDMNEFHLRNAISKLYREWLTKIAKFEIREFIKALTQGPNDALFLTLVKTLATK